MCVNDMVRSADLFEALCCLIDGVIYEFFSLFSPCNLYFGFLIHDCSVIILLVLHAPRI